MSLLGVQSFPCSFTEVNGSASAMKDPTPFNILVEVAHNFLKYEIANRAKRHGRRGGGLSKPKMQAANVILTPRTVAVLYTTYNIAAYTR